MNCIEILKGIYSWKYQNQIRFDKENTIVCEKEISNIFVLYNSVSSTGKFLPSFNNSFQFNKDASFLLFQCLSQSRKIQSTIQVHAFNRKGKRHFLFLIVEFLSLKIKSAKVSDKLLFLNSRTLGMNWMTYSKTEENRTFIRKFFTIVYSRSFKEICWVFKGRKNLIVYVMIFKRLPEITKVVPGLFRVKYMCF